MIGTPPRLRSKASIIDSSDIRVLHVIGAVDPEFGGTAEVSVSMCIASQRAGIPTTLLFAADAGAEDVIRTVETRLRSEGVAVRHFRTVGLARFYARRWGISIQLCRWVMRHAGRFDVIHIHQAWGLAQVAAFLATMAWQRPCVITPHESLTNYDIDREKRFVKSLLKRWYLSAATRVWLTSPLEASDSMPPRHLSKSRIVPYPLAASEAWPVSAPRRTPNPDEPLTVGFLGRLHPKKNVDLVIRSIALAPDGIRLRVAGDGPAPIKRDLMQCAADNGVAERVEWLGFVTRDNRSAFFESINVLVLVSEYESFGLAVAEAMAHGLPVIVSSRTGIAPIITMYECGMVVEPTQAAVAGALQRLAADPALVMRLGSQGPVAVEKELSMDAYGVGARSGYQQLISTPGR